MAQGLTINIHYAPRAQFAPFHARARRFACLVAHRRCGKTVACLADLVMRALNDKRRDPRYAYIAPLYKQAKDVAWPYLKSFLAPLGVLVRTHEGELRASLPNGAVIRLYGADNPDALRGIYLDGVVLDEMADIDPRLWPEVIRPALADRAGWAVFIGTPRGRDAFYTLMRQAQKQATDWYTAIFKASETGILPAEELTQAAREMSLSQYAREFECSFDEPDSDQFIAAEAIEQAIARSSPALGPRVLGVDVARFGDDRSVILARNGDKLEEIETYRGLDVMQVAGRVTEAIGRYRPDATFIDGVGLGAGVVDRVKQLGYAGIFEVNAGAAARTADRFANKRAEMWARMRDWIRDRADLPENTELLDDLTALTYGFDHRNRMKLEAKADLKARGLPSPDLGDALALTFAEHVAPRDLRDNSQWDKAEPEDNPFAEL